jgi:hypothetical protein
MTETEGKDADQPIETFMETGLLLPILELLLVT